MPFAPNFNIDNSIQNKWRKLVAIMEKCVWPPITKIAKAGSRSRQEHKPTSDLDIIFAVTGNPPRSVFYPELMKVLKANYPHEDVHPGTSYHVVKLIFRDGGKFDLVLLTEIEFDNQHSKDVEYRRTNL